MCAKSGKPDGLLIPSDVRFGSAVVVPMHQGGQRRVEISQNRGGLLLGGDVTCDLNGISLQVSFLLQA